MSWAAEAVWGCPDLRRYILWMNTHRKMLRIMAGYHRLLLGSRLLPLSA